MSSAKQAIRVAFIALPACLALVIAIVAPAQAATGPKWKIDSLSAATVEAGKNLRFTVEPRNIGDAPTTEPGPDGTLGTEDDVPIPIEISATLPPGVTVALKPDGVNAVSAGVLEFGTAVHPCTWENGGPGEESKVLCAFTVVLGPQSSVQLNLTAAVEAGAAGTLKSQFGVKGGGAGTASTVDFTAVGPEPPFGIDAFDNLVADAAGNSYSRAAGHPDSITTTIDFNSLDDLTPFVNGPHSVQPPRDVLVELPPGLLGNSTVAAQCKLSELANSGGGASSRPLCSPASQVGTTTIRFRPPGLTSFFGPLPVFNMTPPPDAPARFGFAAFGTVVVLDATLRSDGDYGLTVGSRQIPEGLAIAGTTVTFWGVPGDPIHGPGQLAERACAGKNPPFTGAPSCDSEAEPRPFLRNPTACTTPGEGLPWSLRMDSWPNPGAQNSSGAPDLSDPAWASASMKSHRLPGYPLRPQEWGEEVGIDGCDNVPFTPSLTATPTTEAADSPTGLSVDLQVPQTCWEHAEEICQSDLRDAEVELPAGMTLNPSAADGLGSCSPAQVGLNTPVGVTPARFDQQPVSCPKNSKIGEATIDTPLLEDPLEGAVYLAKQSDNPFGSLLAMYLVAEGSGVIIKQAGEIQTGPGGRLTTVFHETPQNPFSELSVSLFGGPRAALRTPPTCGEYAVQGTLTPWSDPGSPVTDSSVFEITSCPNSGFDPQLDAGTENPLAGSFSPFNLHLSRADGTQELAGLTAALPEGLIGRPAGIPYCPESVLRSISGALGAGAAWIASPGCPAASQVGTVTVGAGAGPTPFFTQAGRAYLAGPYKGAPLSLAVVAPAVAGPFDLGTVLVRNALRVDPATAQITAVSDPIPTALHDVGLDLRDIRVDLNRPSFTLNPTSCDPMAVDATLASVAGASAQRSSRFQVGGCDRLAFKPKLALRLKGSHTRRGHPSLRATLTMPPGGANIDHASVALPASELLDNAHIGTVCTRVQYAADQCPAASVYGYARAISPLLDSPLEGPVYLRSSEHALPDLLAALHGQIDVDLAGRIDSTKAGGIRTTFDTVPDAPVTKFTLEMAGGKKGLLQNSTNLCAHPHRATARFDAQNGKTRDFSPMVRADCGARAKHRAHRDRSSR